MFEKDTRRVTRERSHIDNNIGSPTRKDKKKSGEDDPNTVYGELKLSEKLSLEIV